MCCAVGKCICQHLSQDAGRALRSRLPTNLADSQCHPAVKNISGRRRGRTVHRISSRPVLAVPPLCYEAGGSCRRVSASGCLFVLSLCQLWPHTPKHTQVVVGMGFPNKCRPVLFKKRKKERKHCESLLCDVFWQRPPRSTPRLFYSASCDLTPLPLKFEVLKQCQLKEVHFASLCPLPDAPSFKSAHSSDIWE